MTEEGSFRKLSVKRKNSPKTGSYTNYRAYSPPPLISILYPNRSVALKKPREPKLRPNTNLLKRFDKVNLTHFGGTVCGGVGWRTFPLGSSESLALCTFDERFIRVSSALQDTRVPLWYLDFVLHGNKAFKFLKLTLYHNKILKNDLVFY